MPRTDAFHRHFSRALEVGHILQISQFTVQNQSRLGPLCDIKTQIKLKSLIPRAML